MTFAHTEFFCPPSLPLMEPTDARTNDYQEQHDIVRWFEWLCENAAAVQRETLRLILEMNCGVEYLRQWLGEVKIQEMSACALESLYTSLVPVVSHEHVEPYIQRIADGYSLPILTQEPVTKLSLSSGTTGGRQKYAPFTRHSARTTLQIFRLAAAYRSRIYPVREGGKVLEFIYSSKVFITEGGLTAGTATTHYYSSEEFREKQAQTKVYTCSPQEVISAGDYNQSSYCHLLLGLYYSEQIEFIASAFAYTLVQAFTSFEETWRELCHDIREGSLSSRITHTEIRKAVLDLISPNPFLAAEIELKCKELETELEWQGLIPKLWPNAKYLYSIMTGSMLPYSKKLRHYAGGLPLVSADYGSTESWIGVNIEPLLPPEDVTFAVVPTFSYFEFIPLRRRQDCCGCDGSGKIIEDDFTEDAPVPLSQVQVGREYELVLTTFTGLYRYRLGDIVEVAGFYGGAPKLNFICRRKLILTINIDKNTEKDLQLVVDKALELLFHRTTKAELVDFTSHANVKFQPGHYVIYWEIKGDVEDDVLKECCREMDCSFVDHGYVVSRSANTIGPLELRIVERGTFRKVMEYSLAKGGGLSQFKTPRCTTNQAVLSILDASTVKSFRSTGYCPGRC